MKILIIEDEKLTARDLAQTIRIIEPDAEILPFLHSVEDARFFFEQVQPIDLIFSDINLGDGTCFEIFQSVQISAPIIFCTAYGEYTLEALQHVGIDYILKPFQKSHIEKALLKYKTLEARFMHNHAAYSELLANRLKISTPATQSILIYQADKIFPLPQSDIAFFFIADQLVYVQTFSAIRYTISATIEQLEEKFYDFFRVNRQYLINRNAIKEASQYFNRKLLIHLSFSYPEPIIVSRLKVPAFLEWLAQSH